MWYNRHRDILISESKRLSENGNYKEFWQKRDAVFLSCGEILVRLSKTLKYPILIVYQESTPYVLPMVFPLVRLFTEEELNDISSRPINYSYGLIKKNIKYFYRRHQNPDGSVCLVETDNLHKDSPSFYSADKIIKRIRDWFEGHSTGIYPPDSPEVELFAHFVAQCKEIEFLYPESFLATDFDHGEFIAGLISHIRKDRNFDTEKRIYLGSLISGSTAAGVLLRPIEFDSCLHFMPEQISTWADLETKPDIFKKEIEEQRLLRGYWWHIKVEPSIFASVNDFCFILGGGDAEIGYRRIYETRVRADVKSLSDKIYFGVRYNNRRSEIEWQLFQLKKKANSTSLLGDDLTSFKSNLDNYDFEAIFCEKFVDSVFHLRNSHRANRKVLKELSVGVVGCGALGSEIADCICKAGIGKIRLIDKDNFRAHNSIRHVIGADKMGIPKVGALSEILSLHNSFVNISAHHINVLDYNITAYLDDHGLAISTIADDNIESRLNEQAIINRVTVFYSRVLRGGKVGRMFLVRPGQDACINCLAHYNAEDSSAFTRIYADPLIPDITNECNNPVRPASAADIKIIAGISSRIILDYLQKGIGKFNHWIWSTEPLESIENSPSFPFYLYQSFIPIHSECQFCNVDKLGKVIINSEVFRLMTSESQSNPTIETGGVLVGQYAHDDAILVKFASGPGPKAKKTESSFVRDIEYCQAFIYEKYQQFGERAIYVGEWHYHTLNISEPSHVDLTSMAQISNQPNYLTDNPLMIIITPDGNASCTVHPSGGTFYHADYTVEDIK